MMIKQGVSTASLPGCVPVTTDNLPVVEYVDIAHEINNFADVKCGYCGEWFSNWEDHIKECVHE